MRIKLLILMVVILEINVLFGQVYYNEEFQVNTSEVPWYGERPAFTVLSNGNLVVCWYKDYNTLAGRLFNKELKPISEELTFFSYEYGSLSKNATKKTTSSSFDTEYDILSLDNGSFIIVYQLEPLIGRIFDANGTFTNNEFYIQNPKPQDDYDHTGAQHPSLALLGNGNFVVCWDYGPTRGATRSGDSRGIYLQIFNQSGQSITDTIRVNSTENYDDWVPIVTAINDSQFVTCWQNGWDWYNTNIYGKNFKNNGENSSEEFLISTNESNNNVNPFVQGLNSGNVLVVWSSDYKIRGKLISAEGNVVNEFIKTSYPDEYITFCQLRNNNIVMWYWGGVCQLFDESLNEIGTEFRIGISRPERNQIRAFEDGFIACWLNHDAQILGKYFLQDPINHSLNSFSILKPQMDETTTYRKPYFTWRKTNNDRLNFPWELKYDIHISKTDDFSESLIYNDILDTCYQFLDTLDQGQIYYWKVLAKNWEGDSLWSSNVNGFFVSNDAVTNIDDEEVIASVYSLEQNYPNPFNPSTMINYQLAMSNDVRLEVYNILGENVAILVSEKQQAGNYSVNFDATGLSSGIYFYRLQVGNEFQKTKKMMYLR